MTGIESAMVAVTEAVFGSVLGCRVRPTSRAVAVQDAQPLAAGCVQLTGAWQGALVILCDAALARRAAAIMLGVAAEAVGADEAQDALGELANMIGGSLQGVLPQPCQVLFPVATEGVETGLGMARSRTVGRFTGECEGWPFQVVLVQRGRGEPLKPAPEEAEKP